MKNTKLFFFLLAVSLLLTCFSPIFAENPRYPTNNGYPVKCNFGFKYVATPTFALDDVTPVDINDYLPAGTIGFEIRASSGGFVTAHEDNIATGSNRIGRLTSDGESLIWNGLAGTFNGVILADDTSCDIIIDGAWGEWSNDDE